MGVRILITGGTVDKSYDLEDGTLQMASSHIEQMLRQARNQVPVATEQVIMKISTKLTEEDVGKLVDRCKQSPEDRLIITHGTDTMVKTAQRVAAANLDKTIVFVGAIIPYIIKESDALFNLGCALTAVQLQPPGVYITMNGRIFLWNEVQKNKPTGVFERLT